MAIDASIIGGLKQPQFDNPLDLYGKSLSIRNAQQQQQLGQQQLQAGELGLQQKQRQDQDQEIARKAFAQAVQSGEPRSASKIAAQMGGSADVVMGMDKHFADLDKEYAEIDDKKLATRKYVNGLTAGLLNKAASDPNYDQNEPLYRQQAAALHPEWKDKLSQPIPKDQLGTLILGVQTDEQLIKEQEDKRAQAKEQREAAGEQRTASQVAAAQDAWDQARNSLPAKIVQQLPVKYSPEGQKMMERLTLSAEQQTQADQAAANAKQTAIRDANTAKNEAANVGLRQSQNQREQKIYDQTYGEGANQALVGVEPKLRVQATTAAQKAAEEHSKAMDSLRNVQSFIDLARSGNKAAGSNLPIMGAESIQALNGIRRINKTELDQYAGAGSLLDKIQGKIGKIVSGQPIPADVMKDIEDLHKTIGDNASKTYNDRINSINQNYKSNFKPVESKSESGPKEVHDKAEYDKLPSGAKYMQNGVTFVKK